MSRALLVIISIIFIFGPSSVRAQEQGITKSESDQIQPIDPGDAFIEPYIPPTGANPYFGQHHAYTVVFRGNGEAVVNTRVAFTNTTSEPMSEIEFRIPDVNADQIYAYQVIRERVCNIYSGAVPGRGVDGAVSGCLEYLEPDYYQTYWNKNTYELAEPELDGDTLRIILPKSVKPKGQGAIMLYFRASGLADKNAWGAYNFNFETLKVNNNIEQLNVGISTDSDLILKGGKGSVDYRYEAPMFAMETAGAADMTTISSNASVDRYYQNIGYGTINKSAQGLAPLEGYIVKGAYADAMWKLFANWIIAGLLFALGIILTIIFAVRFITKKPLAADTGAPAYSGAKKFATLALLSFGSSILITGYSIFLYFIMSNLNSVFGYREEALLVALLFMIVSFGVYLALVLIPAIFIGQKFDLWWGVATASMTIIWMVVYLGIIAVFVLTTNMYQEYPVPVFMRDAVVEPELEYETLEMNTESTETMSIDTPLGY